jgi:hypothetical protein
LKERLGLKIYTFGRVEPAFQDFLGNGTNNDLIRADFVTETESGMRLRRLDVKE